LAASTGTYQNHRLKSHRDTPALPFCHFTLKAQKPVQKGYPLEPKTVGDHIKKKRLDLGLLQKDVARQIGVKTACLTPWERNLVKPSFVNVPGIIKFVGYSPYEDQAKTFGQKIVAFRRNHGLSQEKLAELTGIHRTTIGDWERDKTKQPDKALLEKLEEFFTSRVTVNQLLFSNLM
jgi:transcriptional regulator with XRE-family HTH domain